MSTETHNLPLFAELFRGTPEPGFVPLSGKELRDSGMTSVLKHSPIEFKKAFKSAIEGLAIGTRFTVERIIDSIGGRPVEVHPNFAGAAIVALAKKDLVRKTSETVKAERAARRNGTEAVWERTRGKDE